MLPRYERAPWLRRRGAFSSSQPALDLFPFKIWANLVARHSRNPLAGSLAYGDPMGLQRLREVIAIYLRTSRAVHCEPQQIIIVSGSQQALDLSARVLLDAGDFIGQYGIRYGELMASSVLVSLPVVAVFFLLQRQFVAGLTAGALKG